jgi:hypothetical protein
VAASEVLPSPSLVHHSRANGVSCGSTPPRKLLSSVVSAQPRRYVSTSCRKVRVDVRHVLRDLLACQAFGTQVSRIVSARYFLESQNLLGVHLLYLQIRTVQVPHLSYALPLNDAQSGRRVRLDHALDLDAPPFHGRFNPEHLRHTLDQAIELALC